MRRVLVLSVMLLVAGSLGRPASAIPLPPSDPGCSTTASGDLNADGYDDIVVGVPGEDVNGQEDAGAVHVNLGGPDEGDDMVTQGTDHSGLFGPGIELVVPDQPEAFDRFGACVAVGPLTNDEFDDLVVGVPGEDVNGIENAGAINVLSGCPCSPALAISGVFWTQDSQGIAETAEANDAFGSSLAIADFDADETSDLAIGAPGEALGKSKPGAGVVQVIYQGEVTEEDGTIGTRLTARGDEVWSQALSTVAGRAEPGDRFGATMTAGDFDGDGRADLAIGVPTEDGSGPTADAGAVNVLYGSDDGLSASGDQMWTQDSTGVLEVTGAGDQFGQALASGDLDDDGAADLIIGAPFEDAALTDIGAAHVLYGTPTGLRAEGDQLLLGGATGDHLGSSFAVADLRGDSSDDLVVGAPDRDVAATEDSGLVYVHEGSAASGLNASPAHEFSQDATNIDDVAEDGDRFGAAVMTSFDPSPFSNGLSALFIGAPGEAIGSAIGAGAVTWIPTNGTQPTPTAGNDFFHQDSSGMDDVAEVDDGFGASLG